MMDLKEAAAAIAAKMVKPLEWGAYPIANFAGPEVAVADCQFNHRYQASRHPQRAQGYIAFLHPILPITSSTSWWESTGHPTFEAAQAAAQAHHAARTIAGMDLSVVVGLVEALREFAAQKTTDELTDDEYGASAFLDAYNMCIFKARTALTDAGVEV